VIPESSSSSVRRTTSAADSSASPSSAVKRRAAARRPPRLETPVDGRVGAHFNTADKPHAYYLQRWLQGHGVADEVFLPWPSAAHAGGRVTRQADRGRRRHNASGVVTSDYHLDRARFVSTGVCQHHGGVGVFLDPDRRSIAGWISSRCGSMRQRRWPRWAQNIRSSVPSAESVVGLNCRDWDTC